VDAACISRNAVSGAKCTLAADDLALSLPSRR
jgi:hypothetical protein